MPQFELIDYPFDQYQRYRITQEIVDLIRQQLDRPCVSILDVGGYFRTITGEDVLPVAQFLPNDDTVVVDMAECTLRSFVQGSGVNLPFADAGFDVVCTCDTLEHVYPGDRLSFVEELLRVAAHYVILAAPFDDERTRLGEQIIFEYVRAFYNTEQPQLKEHIENGLPDRERMRFWLTERGYAFTAFPSGYLHHWLPMMLLKQYLYGHPDTAGLHVKMDRYYNLNHYQLDHRAPGYRHVFVVSKSADGSGVLTQVSQAFQPRQTPTVDDGVALSRSMLTLIEWEREWQREQTRQARERQQERLFEAVQALNANAQIDELVSRATELNALRDLVARSIHPGVSPVSIEAGGDVAPTGEGVLLISPFPVGKTMPSTVARLWEMAAVLSSDNRVTFLGTDVKAVSDPAVNLLSYDRNEDWDDLVQGHQIVVIQGARIRRDPGLLQAVVSQGKYLVVDLCDPFPFSSLSGAVTDPALVRENLVEWSALIEEIKLGDFFLCANDRQRDFWLGILGAHYRLNPHTYREDPEFRRLIDLVPFGIPRDPPVHRRQVLKGVHSQVGPNDVVAVWLGEIDDHSDPLTLVQAWARIAAERQGAKLFFFSPGLHYTKEPSTVLAYHAVELAKELGVYDRHVFFRPAVPYEDRGSYLLEADLGVYLNAPHAASWYACSAPLMNYVWAGLPMVTTIGNSLERVIDISALAISIEPRDVSSLTAAILGLLAEAGHKEKRSADFTPVTSQLTWERVAKPLTRFCRAPWRAADKRTPDYLAWSSTAWQKLVMDRAYTQQYNEQLLQHIEDLRSGRVMKLANAAGHLWRRARGDD